MSKISFRLIQLILVLPIFLFFLPKITLAANCSFTYDPLTPNQNMGDLRVTVRSNDMESGDYGAILVRPTHPDIMTSLYDTQFVTGQPSTFTIVKSGIDWREGNYQLYIMKKGTSFYVKDFPSQASCSNSFSIISLSSQCSLTPEQNGNFKPNEKPTIDVFNIPQQNCSFNKYTGGFDLYLDNKNLRVYCPETGNIILDPQPVGNHTVEIKDRCGIDFFGSCLRQTICAATSFHVFPLDQVPPPATNPTCQISPDPAIIKRPITTLDPVFITGSNLTPNLIYKISLLDPTGKSGYLPGTTKSKSQGIVQFQIGTNPIPGDYQATLFNEDGKQICLVSYKIEDASKVKVPNVCSGSECTSGGGKPVEGCTNDPNHPAIATAIGCIHTNPAEFVKDMLKFLLGIGGGLAFLMMLLGAFQMLTSAGNPETLNAGKSRLTSAVIGLLIVIFAVLLMQIIGFDILQLPGFGR